MKTSDYFGITPERMEKGYSVSNNFRLKLIEPSAREVFIFWTLVEREERGASEERRGEHGSNLARLKQRRSSSY